MILCYSEIKDAIRWGLWPVCRDGEAIGASDLQINPNSIDVTLGNIALWPETGKTVIDPRNPETLAWREETFDELVLDPGGFVLAHVRERFDCNLALMIDGKMRHFIPMIEGRSTLARCGLSIHQTAGFGDVGFDGNFTIELSAHLPIVLRPGDRIAQVYFVEASSGSRRYSGAYTGQYDAPRAPTLGDGRV